MKQYIVKQTDKNVIEKIGETRFIIFADNFIEAVKKASRSLIEMGIFVDYTCLDFKKQFGYLPENEVYSESSKEGYIIVIYDDIKQFGHFTVKEEY